jgi:single-stranded-DNA-specific exonuclease
VVVLDHHQVPEEMPPAAALLNPHQDGCEFPFKGLCSAGVAFYICAALRTRLGQRGRQNLPDPRAWLDLVALGTVCDMVPLVEENRVLTSHGLALLQQRRRPGIRALLDKARVGPGEHLDETHLGFTIGPRLNAPGRLSSAEPSLSLLRARSDAEASAMAAEVEMFNTRRKELQRRISAATAWSIASTGRHSSSVSTPVRERHGGRRAVAQALTFVLP